jgi:hypothetical protein
MSFSVDSGYPLVKIYGKGPLNKKIIRVEDKQKVNKNNHMLELNLNDNYNFQVIPNIDAERSTIYICGMAGSGKSYFIAGWLKEYSKIYPNNPIYIFSEKQEDKQLDEIKNVSRVKISPELSELDYLEFSNSCCVFDDIDSIDKPQRKIVNAIRDKVLKLGRSAKISVVCSNHSPTDGLDTKTLLNEAQMIVFFLNNWNRSLKYLVQNYLGMTKEDIKKAKKNNSRWTCYCKQSYPNVVIQHKNMFIAGQED